MKAWQFEPLDSSFFRGARSFQQNEQGFLESQFPPTAQTLAGVIRSAIAESEGVDWAAFRNGEQDDIAALIGEDADHTGKLSFTGPYLTGGENRLYPVPLHLLYSKEQKQWGKLEPSVQAYNTDMGEKRLPQVDTDIKGAKPLEDAWLDAENLSRVLQGGVPERFILSGDLFAYESRTGIKRNNHERKTEEGALFFTRHIRLKEGVRLVMDVDGSDDVRPAAMLRLGGEGRMAHVEVVDAVDSRLRGNDSDTGQFMIVLLTHGDFDGKSVPVLPEGMSIVSACVGKAVREGGWDYKNRKPKPLKSLVPAGSVFFVTGAASKLKSSIGERKEFGYGEIAIGTWEE